jgi:hypothetical protein
MIYAPCKTFEFLDYISLEAGSGLKSTASWLRKDNGFLFVIDVAFRHGHTQLGASGAHFVYLSVFVQVYRTWSWKESVRHQWLIDRA